ncbi:MAG: single-stranded DNA-binding protein [Erysipelotrichaceae bacterium]|nr:single-stranded DNA-binding protein [Erysipelotrichaceae bacterium]
MNHFYLIGKLAEEPEKSVTTSGTKMIKFRVTAYGSNKESDNMGGINELVGFNGIAEEEYETGTIMCFAGRIGTNNYTKDGVTYYRNNLIVNSIATLG